MKCLLFLCMMGSFKMVLAQNLTDLLSSDMDLSVVSTADAGPSALISNPALNAMAKYKMAGINADNRFGLMELGLVRFSCVFPVDSRQSFGMILSKAGLDQYHENRIEISYARKLSDKTAIGLSFGGDRFSKSKDQKAISIRAGLGIIMQWNQRSSFGFVIQNPWQPYSGKTYGDTTNMIFMLGYGYNPSEQLRLNFDLKKTISNEWFMIFGIVFSPSKKMNLQYHFRTSANTHQLGAVIFGKKISTRVYVSYHNILGLSGGTGIFNNNPNQVTK